MTRGWFSLVLVGLWMLLLGVVPSSVSADDGPATRVTPTKIRQAAIASFRNSRSAFMVYRQIPDIAFFPFSTSFPNRDWRNYFEEIKLKNVAIDSNGNIRPSGTLLSLKNTGAQAGDIVVLERGKNNTSMAPFVLVYMGEETFKDIANRSVSFFVYPYLTRLEYNTFPPRFHRQLVKQIASAKLPDLSGDEIKSLPTTTDRRVENAPGDQGTWEWLRKRVGTPPRGFVHSRAWRDGSYRVVRARSSATEKGAADLAAKSRKVGEATVVTIDDLVPSIRIMFDPRKSSKAHEAERIGFVQVGRLMVRTGSKPIDSKKDNWSPVPISQYFLFAKQIEPDQSKKEDLQRESELKEMVSTPSQYFLDGGPTIPYIYLHKNLRDISYDERTPSATKFADKSAYGKKSVSRSFPAVHWDAPKLNAFEWFDPANNPGGVREVVVKFETWSWCERGTDVGAWYEGVKWEWHRSWDRQEDSTITLNPAPLDEPSANFIEAFEQYNKAANYVPGK